MFHGPHLYQSIRHQSIGEGWCLRDPPVRLFDRTDEEGMEVGLVLLDIEGNLLIGDSAERG
jgi:hypothetical protein